MPGAEGYVNDPPAAVNADSTASTNDSSIALMKANKNLMRALLAKWPDQSGGKVPVEATVEVAEVTKKVQLHAPIDFSSASAQTIVAAPGIGKRIRLTHLSLSSGGTPQVNVELTLMSGAAPIETVKGGAMVFTYSEHRNLGTNEAFVIQAATADRVIGGADYYVEDIA
jgi:hypothetical protein